MEATKPMFCSTLLAENGGGKKQEKKNCHDYHL